MARPSPLLAQGFSNVGHSYSHILTILYPTVVIALEKAWGASYGELLALMLAGQILFGVAALPAGWFGDKWSMVGMMVAFFIGTGLAGVLTGFADTPFEIGLGLALIGLFASIYHPVGMAWLVRNATNRGKALGFNGIFGAFGLALGPLIAGALTDFFSWRAAFIIPGATCAVFGVALFVLWRIGYVQDTHVDLKPVPAPSRNHAVRAFFVLSLTMLCVGVIGQTLTFIMPKLFADKAQSITGGGALGAGSLVTIVYLFAAMAQYAGGHLADRFSMKRVYIVCFAIQAPILILAAALENWPLLFVATAMVFVNTGSVPAENGLLALYTPAKWRGTAFGAKFVLALGVSALAIPLVAVLYDGTGGFFWVFVTLSALAAVVAIAGAMLPTERRDSSRDLAAAAEPAE